MKARLNAYKVAPEAMQPLIELDAYLKNSGLDTTLLDLVKIRASQQNGCAFCINMHSQEARANGETEQRIYLLDAWRESPLYSDVERAALAWTEAVTRIAEGHAPDAVYEPLREHFSDRDIVQLTVAIAAINAWNRMGIALREVHPTPGSRAARVVELDAKP